MPSATANVTWNCEIVSKEILDWVEVCMLRRKISKQNCQQIPGYYRWIEDSKLSADTRILWVDRGSKLKGNCLVIGEVSEPCDKIRVRNKRKKIEEVCQNTTETMTMEEWKTIWGPSLLETYSYLGKVNWCIVWEGKKNQDFGQKSLFKEQYRKKVEMMELWNCTQVLTCDTPPVQIGLEPVRVLLQWGCECRGYNHTLAKKEKEPWDCKTTTVRSPGNLVWVMGHGLWTTHMPIDGAVTQITLGVPTLCPFWKTSKLQEKELVSRKKREIEDDASIQEDWHEPDDGVKGYKNSPTIFGEQLAKDLESWEPPPGEGQLLQYVDDLLIATRPQETCVDWTSLRQKGDTDWLSPQRFLKYQAILVEQDDVEIVVTNIVNPASFLRGSMGEPVIHDCLETIEATYSSRPDLKDSPLEDAETWFTDGSSYVVSGRRYAGYAVTTSKEAHQKVCSELEEGNMLADREAKDAAKGEVPDKAVEAALIPDGKISIGEATAAGSGCPCGSAGTWTVVMSVDSIAAPSDSPLSG
ncbi:hypothetical protein DUI87_03481 [Hirundo rustica rustica]|uniref:RNase H type-1 domain-containing protein n=1 Tax=Hirundo rustica rustica TaxID=333673 RepID=A0A3M0L3C9_HIRRU|nr:hypothetical protein DUI87_03481 [Hirundo rustica rustica]